MRAGLPVYSGAVNIDGRSYTLAPTAFPLTDDNQTHYMHGLVGQEPHAGRPGTGSWPPACYDYAATDQQRAPTIAAAAGRDRRRRHPAGPGRHRLEHAGRQGHLAAAGRGRRARRRFRRRPRRVQARASSRATCWATGSATARPAAGERVGGTPELQSPGCRTAGRFAPRLEGGAGPALRTTGSARTAVTRQRDQRPDLSRPRSESVSSRRRPRSPGRWPGARCSRPRSAARCAFPTVGELYGATSAGALVSSSTIRTCARSGPGPAS